MLVHKEDLGHSGGVKVCPKITNSHINPSQCEKMRVKLETQIFSHSMAAGIQFYRGKVVHSLARSEATEEFSLVLNKTP